jgi:hypothetical protein
MSPGKPTDPFRESVYLKKYRVHFAWLENDGQIEMEGVGSFNPHAPESTPGLNLPRAALENIYYRNAVRLIPHVREAMQALGYSVASDPEKPAAEATPRAQRLGVLLPRVTERDILSLSAADRAAVRTEVQRIAGLTQ